MTPLACTVTTREDGCAELQFDRRRYQAPVGKDLLMRQLVRRLDRLVARHADACEVEDLRLLGRALFQLLFEGGQAVEFAISDDGQKRSFEPEPGRTLGQVLCRALEQNSGAPVRLELVFEPGQADLAGYPWEFLYIPSGAGEGFFAAGEDVSLSISRSVPPLVERRQFGSPLKVWVASAAPSRLGKVDNIDLIVRTLRNKLGQLGELDFKHLAAVTWKTLQSSLDAAARTGGSPDILHFIGHGDLNGGKSVIALMRDPDDTSRLPPELRDQDAVPDNVDWCDVGELARQLRPAPPWLLFLQTCKGASNDTQVEGARSAAQQLADAKVSFVVAMQYEIENTDAAMFAEAFYACLGSGGMIDDAVRAGRIKLGNQRPAWQHRRFATPVVYLRSTEQALRIAGPATPAGSASGAQLCPYCKRSSLDLDSSECACPDNRPLKYCTENHANRLDATVCINRRCTGHFDPPRIVPLPAFPAASGRTAAIPSAGPLEPGLA